MIGFFSNVELELPPTHQRELPPAVTIEGDADGIG